MYHPQSPELKEASPHGTQSFPCAFYQTQMSGHGFMVKHHWHKEAEILYFPGGNFRMEINMEAFDIRSECFYFINPGELHSVRLLLQKSCRNMQWSFTRSCFAPLFMIRFSPSSSSRCKTDSCIFQDPLKKNIQLFPGCGPYF